MFILLIFNIFEFRDFNIQVSLPKLQVLILDNNMIENINNFPSIPSLLTLSMTNNGLHDLISFINAAKIKFPRLRSVNVFKNPMHPGMMDTQNYSQFKNYMRSITTLTELDGMNINDNSFMNQQGQQTNQKRDLFGTSNNISQSTNPSQRVDFFGNQSQTTVKNPATNPAPQRKKVGMFDNMPNPSPKTLSQSVMVPSMNTRNDDTFNLNVNNGKVYKRLMFVIDESGEYDGTEFVLSKKKKSTIMINEKIFRKSDNMTNFNRKNRSEGNKHILNKDL
jgi:hypothetical protein